eukprot:evm.model.scf_215EXC.5 EVM.evm.TU.scf_215EXC.5   scf_215EXC:76582-77256(-)
MADAGRFVTVKSRAVRQLVGISEDPGSGLCLDIGHEPLLVKGATEALAMHCDDDLTRDVLRLCGGLCRDSPSIRELLFER